MSATRRHLLLTGAALGLSAAVPGPSPQGQAAPPKAVADPRSPRCWTPSSRRCWSPSPETATGLGLDTGARAA